jgi:hypothetical protein
MTLYLRPCLLFLFFLWCFFAGAGWLFYRWRQRAVPQPFRDGDIRNRFVRPWRFIMFVILLPLAAALSTAIGLVWAADMGIIPEF